jgi:DNA adenine methylase
MANKIISLMPEHKSYLEPYFGSGAVLLSKEPSRIETINDMDDDIVNLFNVIRQWPDELKKVMEYTPYSRTEYNNAFKSNTDDSIEKARLFLIKSLQSHGFRVTEKSGWKNDVQGREKSYCVSHWCEVPNIISEITQRLRQVQIEHMDAIELIKRFNYRNVFIYLDPPYLLNTRTRKQYRHEMSDSDHVRLLETILQSNAKVMISGYQSELYDSYLKDWAKLSFNATAEHGLKRTEVLWMNYKSNQMTLDEWISE